MSSDKKKPLVFIDTRDPDGHEADFRFALIKALVKTPYLIFEDFSKKPESIFSATVGGILISHVVLIDGAPQTNRILSDSLIQYGICRALEKPCIFIGIKSNIQRENLEVNNTIVEGYAEFNYYLDFATQFKVNFLEQLDNSKVALKIKPNKLPVHAFIVFGVDRWKKPDLYESIMSFSNGTGWSSRIISDIGSFSKLESLANAVSQRSFCVFCLEEIENEKVFIGIGLAIGMGRPFLIIKHKQVSLPNSLNGYHGVIEYESYSQLKDKLTKYTGEFLSEQVFNWEGATYNDLLFKLEKQVSSMSPTALTEVEDVLQTVISVLGSTTAKPYALLGEVYREKNRKISPNNTELLIKAKEYYGKALIIQNDYQLYQNAVDAIDKHIQLIELIKEKKYRSIPTLINLIGGELKGDHYLLVKEYLLNVVIRLVEQKNYAHAISLLAAMQVHDKSDQIQKLIQQILNLAPHEIIKALQDSQKLVAELENYKTQIDNQVKEKDLQLDKIAKELASSNSQLAVGKEGMEKIKKERDKLNSELKDNSSQLDVFHEVITNLESEIESAKAIVGRGVLVNFGKGWGIYRAIDGEPYVIRDQSKLRAKKGRALYSGDIVYDENGDVVVDLLPGDAIVIKPDDDYYTDVSTLINNE